MQSQQFVETFKAQISAIQEAFEHTKQYKIIFLLHNDSLFGDIPKDELTMVDQKRCRASSL